LKLASWDTVKRVAALSAGTLMIYMGVMAFAIYFTSVAQYGFKGAAYTALFLVVGVPALLIGSALVYWAAKRREVAAEAKPKGEGAAAERARRRAAKPSRR